MTHRGAGGPLKAAWEVKPDRYFGHSRGWKLAVAEHRSQMLLERINLARCK